MTRVAATFDPMPVLRQAKKDHVNAGFNDVAASAAHVEQAHAQKREWASARDPRLRAEADLRGMTLDELAALILTKPDELAARGAADRDHGENRQGDNARGVGGNHGMTFPSYSVG